MRSPSSELLLKDLLTPPEFVASTSAAPSPLRSLEKSTITQAVKSFLERSMLDRMHVQLRYRYRLCLMFIELLQSPPWLLVLVDAREFEGILTYGLEAMNAIGDTSYEIYHTAS